MTTDKKKDFDCVDCKIAAQEAIYEDIKNLTSEEEIQYFRRVAEEGSFGELYGKQNGSETPPPKKS